MKRLLLAIVWAGFAGAASAQGASPSAAADQPDVQPDWAMLPARLPIMEMFPPDARKRGVSGDVVLLCTITVKGRASDCSAVVETPPDAGFGAAAIRFSKLFRFSPAKKGGKPVPAALKIPIAFHIAPPPARDPPNASAASQPSPWAHVPTADEFNSVSLKRAMDQGVEGAVTVECDVVKPATITNCRVLEENPTGWGFGSAALSLTRYFVLKPPTSPGAWERGTIKIPMKWIPPRHR